MGARRLTFRIGGCMYMEFIGCDKIICSFSHSAFRQNMKQTWHVTGSIIGTDFIHRTPFMKLGVKVEIDKEHMHIK